MFDEEIDLTLPPQASEDNRLGERRVPCRKCRRVRAQQIGRVATFADLLKYLKRYNAGR